MKKLAFTLAFGLATTGMVFAQSMTELDADGSGALSLEELQVIYPSATEDTFVTIDANADGAVDEAELTAAVEAGTLTTDS
ncbi:EF-hand domain-containing protein [Defluviimonas aestuarii]|uniref:EF-hand domain-containing protein n=1 Tax=Albidovulum aestuarii TaxID=1130726 RepID=UPI00249AD7D6|nr:EF-hand domain-containing protein [Defluviimonas aestuarii]MDI3335836.1 EF-hand domain-containing protein [Defluviimonas aestuarii]